jgi:phosphate transport system protein
MDTRVRHALEQAVRALMDADGERAKAVAEGDDLIDAQCQDIQRRAVELLGLQQPVASDLRLLVGSMQVALHLERIGDMAVGIADVTQAAVSLRPNDEMAQQLQDMCERAVATTQLAVTAFTQRDRALCHQVPDLDEQVDHLYRDMIDHILDGDADPPRREWALRMLQVSRYLERAADHAVDIAEQAWFLITGELRELG